MNKKKMAHQSILFICLLVLVSVFANAQSSENYAVAFSYKNTIIGNVFSIISADVSKGTLSPSDPNGNHRLDVISEGGEVLSSTKFSLPALTQDTQEINFTIIAPYHDNAKSLLVYGNRENKIFDFEVSAQSPDHYVVGFSYKNTQLANFLSLLSTDISGGSSPIPSDKNGNHRLDVISEGGEVLSSTKFSLPALTQGTQEINFTIIAPYHDNAKSLLVYGNRENKIFEVPAAKKAIQPQSEELIGELRIVHGDNFEHPENTQYYYYLHTGSKVYQLQSAQFPNILSGTIVKVQGTLSGDVITLKDSSAIEPVNAAVNPFPVFNQPQAAKDETPQGFGSKWVYASLLVILVLILL